MKEKISFWKNGKLIIKKLRADKIEAYVNRKGISLYYKWGYAFIAL